MPFKVLATLTAALLARHCVGIELEDPVVGCSAVECPSRANTSLTDCRVGDRSFSAIGLAHLDTSLADDFTWTQGVSRSIFDNVEADGEEVDRVFQKIFYLGTPTDFDLVAQEREAGLAGCALFFTNVSPAVSFDNEDDEDDVETSTGTCEEAMDEACVAALLMQARDVAQQLPDSSTTDACRRFGEKIRDSLVFECSQYATGEQWEGLQIRELTGSNAATPISKSENKTSTCHPTLPKTNNLTEIAAFSTSGTSSRDSVFENTYGITPILTVFFPLEPSRSPLLLQPEAQLTCLKVIGSIVVEDTEQVSGDEEEAGAVRKAMSPFLLGLILLAIPVGFMFS